MNSKMPSGDHDQASLFLRTISSQDFLNFGMHHVAYVKPVHIEGEQVFAIHAADGTPLSVMNSLDDAILAVKENDLEAVNLH